MASDLGLQCLQTTLLRVSWLQWVKSISDRYWPYWKITVQYRFKHNTSWEILYKSKYSISTWNLKSLSECLDVFLNDYVSTFLISSLYKAGTHEVFPFCLHQISFLILVVRYPYYQHLAHLKISITQFLHLGPVVQSIVTLTSSLRVISLTVLADSINNIQIFFCWKNVSSFCTAKAIHIFSAEHFSIFAYHSM